MANKQLLDYLKKGSEKNIPIILLKQNLVKRGWPQQLVEEAADEIQKSQENKKEVFAEEHKPVGVIDTRGVKKEEKLEAPKTSENKQYSPLVKIGVLIMLFVIVLTSGTLLYSNFIAKEDNIQPKEALIVETTKIVSEEAEEIDLANLAGQVQMQSNTLEAQECNFNLNCNDLNPCTAERVDNPKCPTTCIYNETTACINDDQCCAIGCSFTTDNDCSATCGDGIVDAGEKCDNNCPASCNDNYAGTKDMLIGSASSCTAECVFTQITACINNDNFCPSNCNNANDNDCSAQEPLEQQPSPVQGTNQTQPGQTCQQQGGFICNSGETCSQAFIQASDSTTCCPVACTAEQQSGGAMPPPPGDIPSIG